MKKPLSLAKPKWTGEQKFVPRSNLWVGPPEHIDCSAHEKMELMARFNSKKALTKGIPVKLFFVEDGVPLTDGKSIKARMFCHKGTFYMRSGDYADHIAFPDGRIHCADWEQQLRWEYI